MCPCFLGVGFRGGNGFLPLFLPLSFFFLFLYFRISENTFYGSLPALFHLLKKLLLLSSLHCCCCCCALGVWFYTIFPCFRSIRFLALYSACGYCAQVLYPLLSRFHKEQEEHTSTRRRTEGRNPVPCLLWMAVVARNEERSEQIDELAVEGEKSLLFHIPCLVNG